MLRLCQPGLIQRLAAVAEQTLTGSLRRLQLRATYLELLQGQFRLVERSSAVGVGPVGTPLVRTQLAYASAWFCVDPLRDAPLAEPVCAVVEPSCAT